MTRKEASFILANIDRRVCDDELNDALDMAIQALEQEPCEDTISRQAELDELNKWDWQELYLPIHFKENIIDVIPSVKPQEPKIGHWKIIPFSNNHGEYRPKEYVCSECGWKIDLCRGLQQDTGHRLFCEHCGADMRKE